MFQRRWGPRPARKRPANRLPAGWRVLSLALLIATLLGSVSAASLDAQEPPITPAQTGEIRPDRDPSGEDDAPTDVIEPAQEPTQEPTVAPTEPDLEPTVEPASPDPAAEDPVDEGPEFGDEPETNPDDFTDESSTLQHGTDDAQVTVYVADCSEIYSEAEFAQFDHVALDLNCPRRPNVSFAISENAQPSPDMQTDGDGAIEWTDIPPAPDNMEVTIFLDAPYIQPRVFCNDNGNGIDEIIDPVDLGNDDFMILIDPGAGEFDICFFALYQPETEQPDTSPSPDPAPDPVDATGRVIVHKHDCSGEYTADDLGAAGFDELFAACPVMPGIIFGITPDGDPNPIQETDASGEITWSDVPVGDVTVFEAAQVGFGAPVVFCAIGDQGPVPFDVAVSQGGEASSAFVLDADSLMECFWFNGRLSDSVQVDKFDCSGVLDADVAYGLSYQELADAGCPRMPGVTFTLTSIAGDAVGITNDQGVVKWNGIEASDITITELAPGPGYGAPIVFCYLNLAQQAVQLGSVDLVVVPGIGLGCQWFNISDEREESEARVVVHKWLCPEGTDANNLSVVEIAATCIVPQPDVEFTITPDVAPNPQVTNAAGVASWGEVPAGDVTITETLPAGFDAPAVVCEDANSIGFEDVDAALSITHPVAAGEALICEWYNIPESDDDGGDTSRVQVDKFNCGDALSAAEAAGADLATLQASCPSAMAGVEFTLDPNVEPNPQETDGNGQVAWAPVDPGQVTITETIPAAYGQPVVFCDDGDGVYESYTVTDGAVDHDLAPSTLLVCKWFNVAEGDGHDDPETGQLFITKYACPVDYDAGNASLAELQADCGNTLLEGVRFVVAPGAAPSPVQFSDQAGEVYWFDIPAGQISVTETIPAGYGQPVVFCEVNGNGLYADEVVINGAITRPLGADETVACEWFNTSVSHDDDPDDPGDDPVITDFPDTGTGPIRAADHFDAGMRAVALMLMAAVAMTLAGGTVAVRARAGR